MSRIHLLPEQIYNKIAAGEVVERPASVLKELLENALDAGAKKISVQVRKAGSEFISVVDDGCGMDADDALLFNKHTGSQALWDALVRQGENADVNGMVDTWARNARTFQDRSRKFWLYK